MLYRVILQFVLRIIQITYIQSVGRMLNFVVHKVTTVL
jgi:hypothetical protein